MSSRFNEGSELRDLRNALTGELVKRFAMRPLNLDDGRADKRSPRERSLEQVRSSDLVVLLLGLTYGTGRAGEPSLTELEFNAALDSGVPVLAYQLSSAVKREDERAQAFRERVERRVTVGLLQGPPERDAAQIVADVYEALQEPRSREVPSLATPGSSVVITGAATVHGSVVAGRDVAMNGREHA